MKSCQLRFMLFFVSSIIITNCFLSVAAPWNLQDGMRLTVPKRMAKLLKKITKQNIDQNSLDQDSVMDMQTTIKLMHLNGLRSNADEPRSQVNKTEEDEHSGLLRRSKRSVKKNNVPPTCHSGKVYVNLTKYTNIIAPLGFHTHYCGNTFLLPVGNDTIIQILSKAIVDAYNSVKKFSAKVLANPSCCAPKKVHNLYILYMDQGRFSTIRSIPNIKASRCVCKTADWIFWRHFSNTIVYLE